VSAASAPPLTAGDVLTLEELRDLRRASPLRSAGLVLHAWAVVAGAMIVYAAWPSPLTLVAAVAVIGSRQLGLAVLAHEAAHWLLFPRQRANDRVARWLCAGPVGIDLRSYRRSHHLHHRYTREAEDPELAEMTRLPISRGTLWRPVLADLSGWSACRLVVAGWRPRRETLIANAALFALLAATDHWALYPLLWLLPLLTWYRLLSRLRQLSEHGRTAVAGDPLRNSRTTAAGPLARAFLAPYWVNHHLEHHLLVFVPCWKLGRAHRLLLAKGHGPGMDLASGYGAVIRSAVAPGR